MFVYTHDVFIDDSFCAVCIPFFQEIACSLYNADVSLRHLLCFKFQLITINRVKLA